MAKKDNTQAKANTQAQDNANALQNMLEQANKEMDARTRIDFTTTCSIGVKDAGKAGIKPVFKYEKVAKNEAGQEVVNTIEVTDPDTVAHLVRLDRLTQAGKTAIIGTCFELSALAKDLDLVHAKSIGDLGARFGIKPNTATQYARVGKYFTEAEDTDNGTQYALRAEVYGASITNLVQVLSLVDDEADDPCHKIWQAISDNKLHLDGTLARVKKEMQELTGKALEKKDSEGAGAGAGKKGNAGKIDYTQALSVLLEKANGIEDTEVKTDALTAIAKLEAIFNAIEKAQAQAQESESEEA